MTSIIASVPALESLWILISLGALSTHVSSECCGSQKPTPWAKAGEEHARTVPSAVAAISLGTANLLDGGHLGPGLLYMTINIILDDRCRASYKESSVFFGPGRER
jgi:hypothetical protein